MVAGFPVAIPAPATPADERFARFDHFVDKGLGIALVATRF